MRFVGVAGSTALLVALSTVVGCTGSDRSGPQGVPENAAIHRDAAYVVLLSLDGFRYDYLDRYPTPAFQRLMREGARAERMIPTFPTKTFPTHYSIATGLYPENHGLVGNRYWAPDRNAKYDISDRATVEDGSWYRGEPIWVTAEKQGMRTAAFFFPGTEADVAGVRPTTWFRYDAAQVNAERVDSTLAWLARPPETRPHLVALYFSDLDDTGHTFGPDSPEVQESIAGVDRALGRMLDGIEALPHGDQVYVVVVSDHGMLRAEASRAQPLDLTPFPGVRMLESGPYASLVVEGGGPERLPGLRDSLQTLLPEAKVWLREELPDRFHYRADPRVGDMVVVADAGATIVAPDRVPEADNFQHGWDNATPEMGAVLLAWGPGIAGGQVLPPVESIHVYPLLTHLLGLEPAPVDGRLEVLSGILGGR